MVVDAVTDPAVPVIVTFAWPIDAALLAVRVSTLASAVGLVPKEAVTPVGRPDTAKDTWPMKLFMAAIVIVSVLLLPWLSETVDDPTPSVKLGAGLTLKLTFTCGAAA